MGDLAAHADLLTTGQVARALGCAPRTVSKLIDSRKLPGFRLETGKHRRVHRSALVSFLKARGIPLGNLEYAGHRRILLIGIDTIRSTWLRDLLPEADGYRLELAQSGFEAGVQTASFHPDTIIIDLALGRSEGLLIAQNLRQSPPYEQTMIIALASEDEATPESLVNYGVSETFKKPFDIALLAERIRRQGMNGRG